MLPPPSSRRRNQAHPAPAQRPPDELTVLMELRMAFGPGTRLWDQRSREELCYDWLRYKARAGNPSFRHFALMLYLREALGSPGRPDLLAIRRRIATVLRSHRIRRPPASRIGTPGQAPLALASVPAARNGSAPSPLPTAVPGIPLPVADCRFEVSFP